ncbi:MAG: site-2 protease family protein [Planctomycetota bacterium]|jgi:regulator of sigma E protease
MLDNIANFALIVLGFGALIFFHELGHFLAAKWAGIRTEVFAVGMGTPVFSWRKGIGAAWGSTHRKVVARTGKSARELSLEELERLGLGATEYSLRWLPIGGFVKMLGQDDIDPKAVSTEPGSYNTCPIGKRMVVVSAGVIANVILAIVLFIWAFMAGVRSEMPVVGDTVVTMPASSARAVNADALGVSEVGLRPGDLVTHINGKPTRTFVDIQIATAMAKPDERLALKVERRGLAEPLEFRIQPEKDPVTGLLGIGIRPGRSSRLFAGDDAEAVGVLLAEIGLAQCGVEPGMKMISAGGSPIETFEQLQEHVVASDGRALPTVWAATDEHGRAMGAEIACALPVSPTYEILRYAAAIPDVEQNVEIGLLGLSPLVRIVEVNSGRRDNVDVLQAGDVILRAGAVDGPRMAQLRAELAQRKGGEIDLVVLRDGVEKKLTARVNRKGVLNIAIDLALFLPLIAEPMNELATAIGPDGASETVKTPVADLMLMGRSRIDAVGDTPVLNWRTFREALRAHTLAAAEAGTGADLSLTVTHPTPGKEQETRTLTLTAGDVEALHALSWTSDLPSGAFEPIYTTLTAGGNPLRAAVMGFQETHKAIMMTYLTLDRLVRGTVGVEQIRGPVGIVDIGTKFAGRGVTYLVFFLGIISVNLAVINFLPIPIVDGGLFLFLVYEKLRGRPPSLAFQNAATIIGVTLIATILLVVTWNDLVRLVG